MVSFILILDWRDLTGDPTCKIVRSVVLFHKESSDYRLKISCLVNGIGLSSVYGLYTSVPDF